MRIEILCLLHFCRPGFRTLHISPWSSKDLQVLRICRSKRLDMGLKRVSWVRRYQGQCRALRPLGHQGYRLRSHNKDQPLCSGYTAATRVGPLFLSGPSPGNLRSAWTSPPNHWRGRIRASGACLRGLCTALLCAPPSAPCAWASCCPMLFSFVLRCTVLHSVGSACLGVVLNSLLPPGGCRD